MPVYCHRCSACGETLTDFRSMGESDQTIMCPKCAEPMGRDYNAERAGNHSMVEFAKPIEMYSIGLNDDDEIREFKRRCPDVDVATDPNNPLYGVPIARTREQKLAALEAVGFEEKN